MTQSPLLSIIIPVYNGSRYIQGLAAQFKNQKTDRVEFLFIDDGSKDDSHALLLQMQREHALPMQVHHQDNKGVSAARNCGIALAAGEYVTFLDVDDAVAPNYLEILLSYAEKNADVVVFDSKRIRESDPLLPATEPAPAQTLTKTQMLTKFLHDPTRLGVVNLLLRKSCLMDKSISYREGYPYYEDYDFLLQVFGQAENVLHLEHILYYYIMRDNSAMGCFSAARINCLKLMQQRGLWLETAAPDFAPLFQKWGTARLYWSVLWQAALAMPDFRDFNTFAETTHAKQYLQKLTDFPDRLLQLSSLLFRCSRRMYHTAVRLAGRSKSRVQAVRLEELLRQIELPAQYY